MELIILGSGTSMPLSHRASPAIALIIDRDPLIFDMGPGTLRQMVRAGLNHQHIRHIFLTHFHPDHTADLVHLLFATRNPSILTNRRPFVIAGAKGLGEFLDHLQGAYGDWLTLPSPVMGIQEFDVEQPTEKSYENFTITVQPVCHTPHSLAYRIEGPTGKCVVISGDTGFCQEIVGLAQGSDLLVLECALPDGKGVEGHLTPSLAGRVATLAGVNRLVLTHFYPECLETDISAQVRKTYGGELILATDLLHVRV